MNEQADRTDQSRAVENQGPVQLSGQTLEQALQQWHRQSRAEHRLAPAARVVLQQRMERASGAGGRWQRRLTELTALAAAVGLLWFWQQGEQLWYHIEQQELDGHLVQIHQLSRDETPPPAAPAAAERLALYQAAYQDYLNSQQLASPKARLFQRRTTADGWQLSACEPFRLELRDDLLSVLRQQSGDAQLWRRLEQSPYVVARLGKSGEVLSLQPSLQPLYCAP